MPLLPSGRRIDFSLDRFHALLRRLEPAEARAVAATLDDPDDLLFVMDTVYFGREDGTAFFAGCMASDWASYAADWNAADRQALLAWFASSEARAGRTDAINYIRMLAFEGPCGVVPYPYMPAEQLRGAHAGDGPRLLQ